MDFRLVAEKYREFMEALGVDFTDENNLNTPERVTKYYKEFFNPEEIKFTTFPSDGMDEMVVVRDIPFYSLCAHHHLPFFGTGVIAYIPDQRIVGLSKLPRTLDYYARRFQNQERITQQVANRLKYELQTENVAVILKARHMCMEMRGIKKHDCQTVTSSLNGVFRSDSQARAELLNLNKL